MYATEKLNKARNAAKILRYIPSIVFIGITGGLSMLNARKNDDIDFYISARSGTVWITRLCSTLLMELFSIRRKPGAREVKDAICLNMFVSEDALEVSLSERDLYTAHEVLQVMPILQRGNTYTLFLKKNRWVSSVFPNRPIDMEKKLSHLIEPSRLLFIEKIIVCLFCYFEPLVKSVQLWYMQKRRTTEVLSDSIIRFHPHDARIWIWMALQKKVKKFHLPLDKKIFHP